MYVCIYVYIYTHTLTHIHAHICVYILYIHRNIHVLFTGKLTCLNYFCYRPYIVT